MTDSQKPILFRYILITVLLLAVYANTLNHGFVWDDVDIIGNSPLLEKLSNIPKFFITEDTAQGEATGYYRPITYVSFALDRALWGLNPVGFNITNLFLHILVALAFYRVVAALFKRENLAFFAALLFSLHPIAGETVNFHAGGRNTLLCALFTLLSLLFYVNKKYLPAIACFILAIFSKEFALLLPAVFLLHDRTINKEKISWLHYLPYAVAIAGYLGLRSFAVHAHANLLTSIRISNVAGIPRLIIGYLKQMAFPVDLKTMYVVPAHGTWTSIIAFSLILSVLAGIVVTFRKKYEILFSASLFLLFLLPVTNMFPLGTTAMADRYAYFALFGFSLALAYCMCLANNKFALSILALLCTFYAAIDVHRNWIWKDNFSFFTQMTKDAPEMSIGYQNLGYAYYNKEDFVNAEKYLQLASSKKDVNPTMLIGHAEMFWEMQKLDKAIASLNKKLELEPGNPQAYIMASTIYEEMGNKTKAKEYHDKAVAAFPGIFEMMKKRAFSSCRQGEAMLERQNFVMAERLFKEALKIDPRFVPALIDMGSLYAEKGDMPKSLHYFTRAAVLEPLNPTPHYNLSLVYESLGNAAKAREEMTQFNELKARSKQ